MTRFRYGTAALVAGAFLLSGCADEPSSVQDAAVERAAPAASSAAKGAVPEAVLPGTAADDGARAGSTATRQVTIATTERAIVYTAELTVRATDVAAAADRAKAIVTGAGGYVAEERSDSRSEGDQAVLTFKVPPARYPDVLAALGRDLGRRLSVHQSAQDLTEEVADVDSRVKSAEATLDQFRTLLSKATKIGDILQIEREIAQREAELESLQARQKALAAQTSMATVTLTLLAEPKPGENEPKDSPGFLTGLRAGWHALVTAGGAVLTVLGALLPWLVPAAVVGAAVRLVLRRLRARAGERT